MRPKKMCKKKMIQKEELEKDRAEKKQNCEEKIINLKKMKN